MRTYETTFIVNPQTDDANIDNQVGAISKLISDNGGKILHENRMGTRRLAYPIQKLTQGYYTTFVYEGVPKILPVLDRHFNLGESYLRHMTVIFEGDLEKINSPREDNYNRDDKHSSDRKRPEPKKEAAAKVVEEKPAEQEAEVVEAAPEPDPVPEAVEDVETKSEEPSKAKDYSEEDEL